MRQGGKPKLQPKNRTPSLERAEQGTRGDSLDSSGGRTPRCRTRVWQNSAEVRRSLQKFAEVCRNSGEVCGIPQKSAEFPGRNNPPPLSARRLIAVNSSDRPASQLCHPTNEPTGQQRATNQPTASQPRASSRGSRPRLPHSTRDGRGRRKGSATPHNTRVAIAVTGGKASA